MDVFINLMERESFLRTYIYQIMTIYKDFKYLIILCQLYINKAGNIHSLKKKKRITQLELKTITAATSYLETFQHQVAG